MRYFKLIVLSGPALLLTGIGERVHAADYILLEKQSSKCGRGFSPNNSIGVYFDQKFCISTAWLVDKDMGTG